MGRACNTQRGETESMQGFDEKARRKETTLRPRNKYENNIKKN
jgi:hypothetical protein